MPQREIKQFSVWWVNLNPTKGAEQRGIRPCVVISANEINRKLPIATIVPLTTKQKSYPTTVKINSISSKEGKMSFALVEQIRNVSQERFVNYIGRINADEIAGIRQVIRYMFLE